MEDDAQLHITPQQQPIQQQVQQPQPMAQDAVQVKSAAHWTKRIKSVPQVRETTPSRSLRNNEPSAASLEVVKRANMGGSMGPVQTLDAKLVDFLKDGKARDSDDVLLMIDERVELVMKKIGGELVPTYERWSTSNCERAKTKALFLKGR